MPNHCTNVIEIRGPVEALKKVKDKYFKDDQLDFNSVIPMPPELQIEEGSRTTEGMEALKKPFEEVASQRWYQNIVGNKKPKDRDEMLMLLEKEPEGKEILKLGKMALDNQRRFGHTTWYSWSSANWNTKWNSYEPWCTKIETNEKGDGVLQFGFDTAWSPPMPVLVELMDQTAGLGDLVMAGYNIDEGGFFFDSFAIRAGEEPIITEHQYEQMISFDEETGEYIEHYSREELIQSMFGMIGVFEDITNQKSLPAPDQE